MHNILTLSNFWTCPIYILSKFWTCPIFGLSKFWTFVSFLDICLIFGHERFFEVFCQKRFSRLFFGKLAFKNSPVENLDFFQIQLFGQKHKSKFS